MNRSNVSSKIFLSRLRTSPTLEQKKKRLPLVDLPIPIEEIVKDLDAVIVTHTHVDHWDEFAAKAIPKYIPIFVQNGSDKN